jgi:uncharacterized membrane protein (UPF0127 family)
MNISIRDCFIAALLALTPSMGNAATPQICHQDNCVSVEVVSKPADLERGLMYRRGMDQARGMLFVFANDGIYRFWMKNMRFSLDMLWIASDGRVVYIAQNVPACAQDPCPNYTSDSPARYVLELNHGYSAAHHWNVDDKLDLKGI